TKSRDTVPMSLIEVHAYDYGEFADFLANQRHYAAMNCGVVPTQNDLLKLQLAVLKNPSKRPEYNKAKELIDKCSMQSLLVEQLTLTPLDTVTTNKEGQFSLSLGRND
ncbi:hypothetical protein, partial [Pseudoalteromonas sp. S16_S37]|uniref:hypothetical protein n=1 Tax=Pseudoalteromonas sp. S16_S37 TaxID=2720228 RepID=UPI0016809446